MGKEFNNLIKYLEIMAKQANGYLGGFSGKLGPAVGYKWKGIWCLRARPRTVNNPRTEAQQEHRAMFKQEVQLAARMRWAVNKGLTAVARQSGLTAQNLFVKANQQAFSMVDGRFAVDYPSLCISTGPVAPVAVTEVAVDEHNTLSVSFEKNPERRPAGGYDNVFLWVYSEATGEGYLTNPVYRRSQSMSVALPDHLAGQALHVYAFVQDGDGRCSASSYGAVDAGNAAATEAATAPEATGKLFSPGHNKEDGLELLDKITLDRNGKEDCCRTGCTGRTGHGSQGPGH